MQFSLPDKNHPLKNAFRLFLFTALFCFVGSHLRQPAELSLFWPVNALLTGIFVRFPWLHRLRYYLVCYGAMVFNDTLFSGWALSAFTINGANVLFILVAVFMLIPRNGPFNASGRVKSALGIFPACLLASVLCASWGTLAQGLLFREGMLRAWSDWLSEQFSTGVLLLPFMLTLPRRPGRLFLRRHWQKGGPVLALLGAIGAAVTIGGGGSLSFPVPALIWCAISYPLWLTSGLTLLTGITEIVLVVHGVMNIQGDDSLLALSHLSSARLGVATVAIGPLIAAVSMDAIRQLNRQLAQRASHDFLTRQLSRFGLYDRLQQLDQNGELHARQAGVLLIDIDYFKAINDNYGHDAGDLVLQEVAQRMQQTVGEAGLVCRFGGEEFLVLLLDRSDAQLLAQAEAIRQRIMQEKFKLRGGAATVTVSIGAASGRLNGDSSEAFNRLISAADKQLFISKRNGRNQTTSASQTRLPV
ncbi:diguanylate cyclase [Mixta tenebrionis]|uniref:diguanylate cyclase n=1 Tax=Mixta tenebrionis TaxID=2562439 RepID=A0A506V591_9GAMM|nr:MULTISPECIES: GGDEF domain-containing protein [Mixta]QHM74086.1 Diguanylate cyclase DosC [Mixta theicola]TPW41064.1 diguanylate cyclase [Mixta tenebrionis]